MTLTGSGRNLAMLWIFIVIVRSLRQLLDELHDLDRLRQELGNAVDFHRDRSIS